MSGRIRSSPSDLTDRMRRGEVRAVFLHTEVILSECIIMTLSAQDVQYPHFVSLSINHIEVEALRKGGEYTYYER